LNEEFTVLLLVDAWHLYNLVLNKDHSHNY